MKLSKRALESLFWADLIGLSPKHFRSDDLFVSALGQEVFLRDAQPEHMVWVPRRPTFDKLLKRKLGLCLEGKQQGGITFLKVDMEGVAVEGAGRTEEEALFSFIERLCDVSQQRLLVKNRPGDSGGGEGGK